MSFDFDAQCELEELQDRAARDRDWSTMVVILRNLRRWGHAELIEYDPTDPTAASIAPFTLHLGDTAVPLSTRQGRLLASFWVGVEPRDTPEVRPT